MKRLVLMAVLVLVLLQAGYCATPQSTTFTYQGDLRENNQPANGNFDLVFKLFDSASGNNQIGSTVTKTAVTVTNGKFTTDLDFPGVFIGDQLWVEVTVGTETLAPRQPINTVPVAQYALATPPPVVSPVFMSSTASATLTTDASGNPSQVGVLPMSGYINTAYPASIIAGLGYVNLTPSGSNTPLAPQLLASDGTIGSIRSRIVLEQPYNGPAGTLTVQVYYAFAGAGALTAPTSALCSVPISAGPIITSNAFDCAQTLATPYAYAEGTGVVIVVSLTSTASTSLQAQVAVSVGP